LVACFGKNERASAHIFTGNQSIGPLEGILALRRSTAPKQRIIFNEPRGRIGLRAVDGSDGKSPIEFLPAASFDYPAESVVVSSRLMTYLELPELSDAEIPKLIAKANAVLSEMRQASGDLVLAPFKGNDRSGRRRRRLDYALARKILNEAVQGLRN
jgi:hypothetical protein